jgi:hypothetical protein
VTIFGEDAPEISETNGIAQRADDVDIVLEFKQQRCF